MSHELTSVLQDPTDPMAGTWRPVVSAFFVLVPHFFHLFLFYVSCASLHSNSTVQWILTIYSLYANGSTAVGSHIMCLKLMPAEYQVEVTIKRMEYANCN